MMSNGPFTVKEMSKMLGKSDKTVYRMLELGKLKGYKELDTWQIFLPSHDNNILNILDTYNPHHTHVQDTSPHTIDNRVSYNGQAISQSRHFVKGLFVGLVLAISLAYLLIILGILNIRWN
ncbi:MAG: helix-turn-helix domain-containing protein [Patescibacteria group bacterium]